MKTFKYTFSPSSLGDDTSFRVASEYARELDFHLRVKFADVNFQVSTNEYMSAGHLISDVGIDAAEFGEIEESIQRHFDEWCGR